MRVQNWRSSSRIATSLASESELAAAWATVFAIAAAVMALGALYQRNGLTLSLALAAGLALSLKEPE